MRKHGKHVGFNGRPPRSGPVESKRASLLAVGVHLFPQVELHPAFERLFEIVSDEADVQGGCQKFRGVARPYSFFEALQTELDFLLEFLNGQVFNLGDAVHLAHGVTLPLDEV